jgi:hypothetical protein
MISWNNMQQMARAEGTVNKSARTFDMKAVEVGGQGRTAEITGTVRQDGWLVANINGPDVACKGVNVPWSHIESPKPIETPAPAPALLPTRAFAGPTQYPPRQFAAYGIVAFTSRAMPDDLSRHQMICNAYIASLPSLKEVSTPIKDQMVTVWPIEADGMADQINTMLRDDRLCKEAVGAYGLVTALDAINDAKRSSAKLDGVGPFLLAWSPSGQKGRSDALVLVSNLSGITTYEQAKQVFLQWSEDIVENPELWRRGWNTEKLKFLIRVWADKYGPKILEAFGAPGK